MMDILGETRGGGWAGGSYGIAGLDERDWVAPGGEGSSEVGGVSVEIIRVVTDCNVLEWRGCKGWSVWLM